MENIKKLLANKSISELEDLNCFIRQLIDKKENEAVSYVSFDTFFLDVIDLLGSSGHTTMQAAISEWHERHPNSVALIGEEDEYTIARYAVMWAYDYIRNPESAEEFYASEYEHSVVEKWETKHNGNGR